jgi:hypothetical protein
LRKQPRSRSVRDGEPADLRREGKGGLGRIGRDGELKEAKLANAGIGMDALCWAGQCSPLCGAIRSSRQELTRVARPGIPKTTKERSTHESKVVKYNFV